MSSVNVDLNVRAVNLRDEVNVINKALSNLSAEVQVGADKRSLSSMVSSLSKALSDATTKGMSQGVTGIAATVQSTVEKSLSDAFKGAKADVEKVLEDAGKKGFAAFYDKLDKAMPKFEGAVDKAAGKLRGALSISPEQLAGGLVKGMGGLIKGLGKVTSKGGDAMAEKFSDAKGIGKLAQGMGAIMGGLGRAASMIGVVVGGVAQLVGLLIDADSQAKDFNKSILSGGTSINDLTTGMYGVRDALDVVRKSAIDFSYNFRMGVTPEEVIAIENSFNQMGYTFKEMEGDAESAYEKQKNLQAVTTAAVSVARQLGIEYTQAAENMASLMEETGGDIDYVSERLLAVSQAANMAGFGTKRFYGIMQNATAGIQMYNVRIEEAAGLLLSMSKILGATAAGNMLDSFKKGFSEEGYLDRLKRVTVTGSEATADILENTIEDTARDLHAKMGDRMASMQGVIDKTLGVAPGEEKAIDLTMLAGEGADPMAVAKQIAKLDSTQQNMMLAAIRGQDSELAIQMEKFIQLSEGTKGGAANQAVAIGALDAGGTLAMKIAQAEKVIGKSISDMHGLDFAAFETITGEGPELVKLAKGFSGQFDLLTSQAFEFQSSYEGKTRAEIEAKQLAQVEQFGAYINEQGEIVTRQTEYDPQGNLKFVGEAVESPIKDLNDYLQSQGDQLAIGLEAPMSRAEVVSSQIAENTLDLATTMKMGVQWVLEQIYGVIQLIYRMMPGFLKDGDREDKRQAMLAENQEEMTAAQEKLQALMTERRDIQAKMGGASPEDKIALEKEMKAKDAQIAFAEKEMEHVQKEQRKIVSATSLSELEIYDKDKQEETGKGLADLGLLPEDIKTGEDMVEFRTDIDEYIKDTAGGAEGLEAFNEALSEAMGLNQNVQQTIDALRSTGDEESLEMADALQHAVEAGVIDYEQRFLKDLREGHESAVDTITRLGDEGLAEAGKWGLEEEAANMVKQMSDETQSIRFAMNFAETEMKHRFQEAAKEKGMTAEEFTGEYLKSGTGRLETAQTVQRQYEGTLQAEVASRGEVSERLDYMNALRKRAEFEKVPGGYFMGKTMSAGLVSSGMAEVPLAERGLGDLSAKYDMFSAIDKIVGGEGEREKSETALLTEGEAGATVALVGQYEAQASTLEETYQATIEGLEAQMEANAISGASNELIEKQIEETKAQHEEDRKKILEGFDDNAQQVIKDRRKDLTEAMVQAERYSQLSALLAEVGAEGTPGEYDDLSGMALLKKLEEDTKKTFTDAEKADLFRSYGAAFADPEAILGRQAHDFIYRSDGRVQFFDTADDIIGARMGGAFDTFGQSLRSFVGMGGGGAAAAAAGGGATSLSFVIQESDNPEATARAVKKILMEVGLV